MLRLLKRLMAFVLTVSALVWVPGCGNIIDDMNQSDNSNDAGYTIVDSEGHIVTLKKDCRVVSLYGSFAEMWILSGGSLVGVTQDAVDERHMDIKSAQIVGSVKEPNVEVITSLNPDYVILSKDLAAHQAIKGSLDNLHINYGYFQVDTFEDYESIMSQFCGINQRSDLYDTNVVNVRAQISQIKNEADNKINKDNPPKILLVRAYTTGLRAKSNDNVAGVILDELGCDNIVDDYPSMLEDLSVEQIILQDPDYIFVLTMGDEAKALEYYNKVISDNQAWNGLSAVKNERCYILPKDLFHYKPNARWAESYRYLADILF